MAQRQYIGARYVIKIYENTEVSGSAEWQANTRYEPLTMVTFQNNSYLSKQPVPAYIGNPAQNPDYWVATGMYNGQIASLQRAVAELETALNAESSTRLYKDTSLENAINLERDNRVSAIAQVVSNLNNEIAARENAISSLQNSLSNEATIRAREDAELDARIDQLVAPSGEAPSAAEVLDARIGVNGTTYSSLGTAIRTQIEDVDTAIANNANDTFDMQKIAPSTIFSPWLNIFIRDDGTVGSDTDNDGKVYACKPNTTYRLKRNSANGIFGIGCVNVSGSELITNVATQTFAKSSTKTELEIRTKSDSTYVLFYALDAEIGNVELYERQTVSNMIVDTVEVPMEKGNLSGGAYVNNYFSERSRTSYFVDIKGAKIIQFLDTNKYTFTYIIMYYYDENYDYLGYAEAYQEDYIGVIADCKYVKFVIYSEDDIDHLLVKFSGANNKPDFHKNRQLTTPSEKITFKVSDGDYATSRLMLPSNYSADGDKIPLILWLDGSGNFAHWNSEISESKVPYLTYLTDEGFAVFSVLAWSYNYLDKYTNCGNAFPYICPTNINCILKGLDFICDRFNIDKDNIHVMSKSQGGQFATYLVSNNIVNAKSIGMFSPVVDYLSMPGEAMYAGTRQALTEDLGLVGDTSYFGSSTYLTYSTEGRAFWAANASKLLLLNEAWSKLIGGTPDGRIEQSLDDAEAFWTNQYWTDPSLVDIYTHDNYTKIGGTPVKVWGASDDDKTPYLAMVQLVSQLKNGGTEAVLTTFNRGTGGHQCADGGSNVVTITSKLGVTYTDLPIGWYQNVLWIREHMEGLKS